MKILSPREWFEWTQEHWAAQPPLLRRTVAFCAIEFLILFILVWVTRPVQAQWFNPVPNTLSDGVVSDAAEVNANFAAIIADGNAGATSLLAQAAAIPFLGLPSGATIMVDTATCPTGYNRADGTNGTLDLRGLYIRGTGGGAAARGTFQSHALQSHTHGSPVIFNAFGALSVFAAGGAANAITGATFNNSPPNTQTQSGGTSETRPNSVVYLHCVKQ